jgi:hypothetical protein
VFNCWRFFLTNFQWLCQFFIFSRSWFNYLDLSIALTN